MTVKFSHLVKNTRPVLEERHWLMEPWVTPCYYHFVSPIKKILMMLAFSLYAEHYGWQLATVAILQVLEAVRFTVVRPYIQLWRNLARGAVDWLMALAFCLLLFLSFSEKWLTDATLPVYNGLAWLVLAICYFFNLYFLVMLVFNLVEKCRGERKLVMDQRQFFFYEHLQTEGNNMGSFMKMVKEGNLLNANLK